MTTGGLAMKYLLTIYEDERRWADMSEDDAKQVMDGYRAFGREAEEAGVLVGGEGLQPTRAATTVRVRGGERMLTDGPFAETKEQLGGYYLLDCGDLDQALEFAAKIPGAQSGSVEVRPVMNYEAAGAAEEHASGGARS
jgi:hypothetical protein